MENPPIAEKIKKCIKIGKMEENNQPDCDDLMDPPKVIRDDYYWMRDDSRKDKKVFDHILKENEYCETSLKHLKPLQNKIYKETLDKINETNKTVSVRYGKYKYYIRTKKGLSYPIHCRKKICSQEQEEIILDENIIANGHKQCDITSLHISIDFKYIAYGVDFSGSEIYTIYIKNLETETIEDKIENTTGNVVWGNDSSCIFYTTVDDEHRSYQVYLHILKENCKVKHTDVLVYQENDKLFSVDINKTSSHRFFVISSSSSETSEKHIIDLNNIDSPELHIKSIKTIKCIQPRLYKLHYYSIEHNNDYLYFITNENECKNGKLVKVNINGDLSKKNWITVKPYDSSIQINNIEMFKTHMVLDGRENGNQQIYVINMKHLDIWKRLEFKEESYSVETATNPEYNSDYVCLEYSSFVTPTKFFDYNMYSGEFIEKKVKPRPNYNSEDYTTKKLFVKSRDNKTMIPVMICYKKTLVLYSGIPKKMLLYGYGSYGICNDPEFDPAIIPLLDRDIIYAVANIRGGSEMGQYWYEDEGKYLNKKNTFYDFIDCAKYFIKEKITEPKLLAIEGRSAGGLLIGTTLNMEPELFNCAIAGVPFLDAVVTMSDPSIPLTTVEWEEWGNPCREKFYEYIKSYSPMQNVKPQNYPTILATSGYNDHRVGYWEALKWVAKLRENTTSSNPIYSLTEIESGHFSANDRYAHLKKTSFEHAFIVDCLSNDSCIF